MFCTTLGWMGNGDESTFSLASVAKRLSVGHRHSLVKARHPCLTVVSLDLGRGCARAGRHYQASIFLVLCPKTTPGPGLAATALPLTRVA